MGRDKDSRIYSLGECIFRCKYCLGGNLHYRIGSGRNAVNQPLHGMGRNEKRRKYRMGRHFLRGDNRLGGNLRFLRRYLGLYYRKNGYFHTAGKFQYGYGMEQRHIWGGDGMERDVHHDILVLGEKTILFHRETASGT